MGRGAVVPAKDITVTWRERKLNEDCGTLILRVRRLVLLSSSSRGSLSNICQIIEKVTQVSGTAQALNPLVSAIALMLRLLIVCWKLRGI